MEIIFFTTQPFTVNVNGKDHSLSKYQKTIIIISGIAGFALLGIGAIFTFYGASYLLRKHVFKQISENNLRGIAEDNLKPRDTLVQSHQRANFSLNAEKILEQLKINILSSIEELKPINELESIQCVITFYTGPKLLQNSKKDIVASDKQDIRSLLISVIEDSVAKVKELDIDNKTKVSIEWSIIAKDKDELLHSVIGEGVLSFNQNQFISHEMKDFFKNVEYKNKALLLEIMSKKLNFYQFLINEKSKRPGSEQLLHSLSSTLNENQPPNPARYTKENEIQSSSMQPGQKKDSDCKKVLPNHSSEQIISFIKGLQAGNPYTELDISENNIDNECLQCICQFIKNDKYLKTLKINRCKIDDKGMQDLISALTNNYSINTFEIKQNNLTYENIIQKIKNSKVLILSIEKDEHSSLSCLSNKQPKIHEQCLQISYCNKNGDISNTLKIIC